MLQVHHLTATWLEHHLPHRLRPTTSQSAPADHLPQRHLPAAHLRERLPATTLSAMCGRCGTIGGVSRL